MINYTLGKGEQVLFKHIQEVPNTHYLTLEFFIVSILLFKYFPTMIKSYMQVRIQQHFPNNL